MPIVRVSVDEAEEDAGLVALNFFTSSAVFDFFSENHGLALLAAVDCVPAPRLTGVKKSEDGSEAIGRSHKPCKVLSSCFKVCLSALVRLSRRSLKSVSFACRFAVIMLARL